MTADVPRLPNQPRPNGPRQENPWVATAVRIAGITAEMPGAATYHLQFVDRRHAEAYDVQPGQFNMLYLPGVGEVAISVSGRGALADSVDHTIRAAGNVTRTLEKLETGMQIGLRGPYGTWWPMERCRGADVLLVAGGIGLAPLRLAIEQILSERSAYGRVTLLYGARTPELMLYSDRFAEWQRRGMQVLTTVDRATAGWQGTVGVVPLLLDRLRPLEAASSIVLMCGPEVMMRYTVRSARERGIEPTQIYLALERNMQCAVGMCGHCQLGPAFICKDGAVFRHDQIGPYLRVENL